MAVNLPSGDPEFMASLAKGLAVLQCFSERERPMTITEASHLTGLSRAATRRCLYTLSHLGFVSQTEFGYSLRPKVLALGYAYLSSSSLSFRAQPILDQLRDELHESCSLGVLDEDEVYYVARAESSRIIASLLRIGSRLPLYPTSVGRVLLASQPVGEQQAYFKRVKPQRLTEHSVTEASQLLKILRTIAEEGFALVDQELEVGLRSVAVPITVNRRAVAAINVTAPANRVPIAELRTCYVKALRKAARDVELMARMPA